MARLAGQQVSGTILASIYHRRIEAPRSRGLVLLKELVRRDDVEVVDVANMLLAAVKTQ